MSALHTVALTPGKHFLIQVIFMVSIQTCFDYLNMEDSRQKLIIFSSEIM